MLKFILHKMCETLANTNFKTSYVEVYQHLPSTTANRKEHFKTSYVEVYLASAYLPYLLDSISKHLMLKFITMPRLIR